MEIKKKKSVAEDMEKRETLQIFGGMQLCTTAMKKSKVLKPHYSYSDMYSMEVKSRSQRDKCAPLFLQLYSQQPRYANNLHVHLQVNEERCDIYDIMHMKKMEILMFRTTWITLEDIIL